ncbi:hypothetical protein [Kurthia sibirica]|uniref:SH3b domain-containing protein n=1 Tax=Kurthia sibirica TaxID=202750 RepID=A0A2U3AKD6_9BACL|nr:hypothetical protein [Kurthia sibirica]PWI25000.1 hypothetical protein DEX24_10525 [Kurthia sibirica]GEK33094.1 hypothetical protein KSI01_06270 [Kurthia sibirica]
MKNKLVMATALTGALFVSSFGANAIQPIEAKAATTIESYKTEYQTTQNLMLRQKADFKESTKKITKVPKGSKVKRTKVYNIGKNSFAYITYKTSAGKTYKGFISNKYFKKVKTSNYVDMKKADYKLTAGMILRAEAGTSTNIKQIKHVKKGTKIKFKGYRTFNGQKFLYMNDGKVRGYLNAKYLKKVAESPFGKYVEIEYDTKNYFYQSNKISHIYPTLGDFDNWRWNVDYDAGTERVYGSQTYNGVNYYDTQVTKDIRGWVEASALKLVKYKNPPKD